MLETQAQKDFNKSQANFFKSAGPLLLILFIDGMGLGLVFPILSALIFDPSSKFIAGSLLTPIMHNFMYGLIIGIFMLCWFFGATILGDLSDRVGRKKALIICLLGTFFSYILSAIAIMLHSLSLLLIGRVVGGLTSGSQPIAQAAIVDLSLQEHKTRNIGYILLALSLGFIVGPLIGGVLSDSHLVSWFNFATPFYFAASIAFANTILLWLTFNETLVIEKAKFTISISHAIDIFVSAFKSEKLRNLSIIFFIFIFGWSSFYSFIAMFLLKIYAFTPTRISIFMALMGVGFGLGNGFLVQYFTQRFSLQNNFIYPACLSAMMTILMVTIHYELFSWLIVVPLASCIAIAYSAVLTLFSNQVEASSQGWVMGITGSIMAFVFGINGIIIGLLATWSAKLPIFIAGISLVLAAITLLLLPIKLHNR